MSETEQMQAFAVSGTATQPQRFLGLGVAVKNERTQA